MGTVLRFHRHKLHGPWCCDYQDEYGRDCLMCTLAVCDTCCSAEGAMPTHCPGVEMTHRQMQGVHAGELDYTASMSWHDPRTDWLPWQKPAVYDGQ